MKGSDPLTTLKPDKNSAANAEVSLARMYYLIALQGTSGQYDRPEVAERQAREIAERIPPFLARRLQERNRPAIGPYCAFEKPTDVMFDRPCWNPTDEIEYFKNALQGTASKFSDPDVVIQKAIEIAEAAAFLGIDHLLTKIRWKYADLPQPMDGDCEAGPTTSGGPPNHAVCRTHGHILNVSARAVIAHDSEEYRKNRSPGRSAGTRR